MESEWGANCGSLFVILLASPVRSTFLSWARSCRQIDPWSFVPVQYSAFPPCNCADTAFLFREPHTHCQSYPACLASAGPQFDESLEGQMNRRLSAILIEALLLLLAYSLAEHLWRGRAWFYDLTGLALLFVSYLALAVGASLMGHAWRR
jgi:hypothetical protein